MQADGVSLGSTVSQLTGVLVSQMEDVGILQSGALKITPYTVQAHESVLYVSTKYTVRTGLCAPRTIGHSLSDSPICDSRSSGIRVASGPTERGIPAVVLVTMFIHHAPVLTRKYTKAGVETAAKYRGQQLHSEMFHRGCKNHSIENQRMRSNTTETRKRNKHWKI